MTCSRSCCQPEPFPDSSWPVGTAGTVPLSPLLGLTLPSGPILPGITQLSWLLARDSPGDPTWGTGAIPATSALSRTGVVLHFCPCWAARGGLMSQTHGTDTPTWGHTLQHAWAAGGGCVQLPAAGAGPGSPTPHHSLPKSWSAASPGMQQCGGAAQPAPQEGVGPHSPLKHYKQNSPSAPGLGCPLRHCPPHTCLALQGPAAAFPSPQKAAHKAWPKGSDFMQQMHL